jgi:peptidoglycan hydrolase CwlO-like protein
MSNIFKAMKAKKKRAVDPNAYRPNLFTHEKQIRDVRSSTENTQAAIDNLLKRVQRLERKISSQNDTIFMLNQRLATRK